MKSIKKIVWLFGISSLCISAVLSDAMAAGNSGEWPCVQRRVDQLSTGQMWPHQITQSADGEAFLARQKVQLLVSQLASRKVSTEQAQELVAHFAQQKSVPDSLYWGLVFNEVLQIINDHRKRIIEGIERYAQSQQSRAREIERLRTDMVRASADQSPDYDQIDSLEETLDWNERIYQDREKSLTYVCESPVLLEKRAFAIARILQQQLPEQ